MFHSHVKVDLTKFPAGGTAADIFLGLCLLLTSMIGLVGNIYSLHFFRSRQTHRRVELINSLYVAISSIDILICLLNFGTIYSHFKGRDPGLYNSLAFCTFWTIFFNYLHKASMFLVMLVGLTRAMKVIKSSHQINPNTVIGSFIGYSFLLVSIDTAIFLLAGSQLSYFYTSDTVYCYEYIPWGNVFLSRDESQDTTSVVVMAINNTKFTLQVGLPPLLIFLSFLVCAAGLKKLLSTSRRRNFSTRLYTNALRTTAYFTSTFLLCNIPFFLVKLLETLSTFLYKTYPGPLFEGSFMFWFSWPVSKVHFTVLNACLNPFLYYWTMNGFKYKIDVLISERFTSVEHL